MQRQKSILSFLKRPSAEQQNSGGRDNGIDGGRAPHFPPKHQNQIGAGIEFTKAISTSTIDDSVDDVRGTDTPPEKVPRQIFPVNGIESGSKNSLFSSIMHKFARFDTTKISCNEKEASVSNNICSVLDKSKSQKEFEDGNLISKQIGRQSICHTNGTTKQESEGCPLVVGTDDIDVLGPDTPGMRPSVPRLKRLHDDICNFEQKSGFSKSNATKRVKFLQDLDGEKKYLEDSEMASKFEWLHPSRIKDAKGKRPGDPLYDQRTLLIPPDALRKMSASQKQYWEVKCQYMDVVLFFKVGKFYELYELDAEIGHKELDWKMTLSGVGKCRQVGISESGIDDAVQKLIDRGYKVGRVEQLETSEQAKSRGSASVIQRKLIGVLTPSTTTEGNIGPNAVHLLAIKEDCFCPDNGSTSFGFAFVDCAALKFWVGSISDDASYAALGALLMQVSPREVIYDSQGLSKEAQKALKKYSLTGSTVSMLTPALHADFGNASEVRNFIQLKGYFKESLNRWDHILEGIMHQDLALCALGGLTNHLSRMMLDDTLHNGDVNSYQLYKGCLRMDGQTLVNLEIFNNNADGAQAGTLYKYLDNCVTASGKRLLRNWICHPLRDVEKINHRLDVVEELIAHSDIMLLVAQYLRKIPDLERLLGRVKASINSSAVLLLPLIGSKKLKQRVKAFGSLVKGLRIGMDLLLLLQKEGFMTSSLAKVLCLPLLIGNDGLDKFLAQFEAAIDSDFPNYQDHDATDSSAETLSILMELFLEKAMQWSQVIHAISCLDVLRSFAVTTSFSSGAMCRPKILPHSRSVDSETGGPILSIEGLWHPYALGENGGLPVPNDMHLGGNNSIYNPCTLLLTGPNMGGKSTLIRATCLTVILAQLGCFVPCQTCVLSLVDIIFTRLGATDRIMTGESTFLIECTETAAVLQTATQDSLVLLDELGRGTSTFDGYAIAYAVFRYLVETVNCRLLFATHYHPLTKEFASHPRVSLQHMACSFKLKSKKSSPGEQELIFLYRLASGPCPESYGMQVAKMAGVPEMVVESASGAAQIMKKLIGESFKSSEQRANFSTLHEQWFKTLLAISRAPETDSDDKFDTLFCLWHELKSSKKMGAIKNI
ncbi:DNA mismatch repair protein MSH7 [Coffea eugenioides]|uniref:DNA mismatch repair protein MSH7 n=1 Tax=Coffea eugenioides TaxID=49369 RepID=UPI000F60D3B4|nr:DNA mismatch repair protein MSH7 [Coffea eugenioides]